MINPTARELLVVVLGDVHELHTAVEVVRLKHTFTLRCSCGAFGVVANVERAAEAVRHVPSVQS